MTTDAIEPQIVNGESPETPKAPPIESRFLFVDVAAQRAKQLRRGARPRVPLTADVPVKYERVAMGEVLEQLIEYSLPPVKAPGGAANQ